jgi:endoglucanase
MHTAVETLNIEDIKFTARLVAEFAKINSTQLGDLVSIL